MRRIGLGLALLAYVGGAAADPAAWQVSAGDGPKLWLLGSVHYLRAADYPLPEIIDRLYAEADELVMELDLDDLAAAEAQRQFLSAAALAPNGSLEDLLGGELYGRLTAKCRDLGLPATAFDGLAPWFVALNLLALGLADAGFAPEYGLEQHLLASATADGKEIVGLETLDTQIGALSGLSAADQRALLAQTLDEIEPSAVEVERLVEAWRNGDLAALRNLLSGDLADFPRLYDTVVKERNERWAERLATLARGRKRCLVVVGALHLVGEDSVVELLRQRGYAVERVEDGAP